MQEVKFTIIMPLYNKERYIAEAIESVLMQKISFSYRLLIIDDASTDNSLSIAKTYQTKHPDKIIIIEQKQNTGLKKLIFNIYANYLQSDYFAVLDPDDYLIDKNFYENGVVFLSEHIEFSMYTSNTYVLKETEKSILVNNCDSRVFTYDDFLNFSLPYLHTSACVYSNIIFKHGMPEHLQNLDEKLKLKESSRAETFRNTIHLRLGKIMFENNFVSVRRKNETGIWTNSASIQQNIANANQMLYLYSYFNKENFNYYIGILANNYLFNSSSDLDEKTTLSDLIAIVKAQNFLLHESVEELSKVRSNLEVIESLNSRVQKLERPKGAYIYIYIYIYAPCQNSFITNL